MSGARGSTLELLGCCWPEGSPRDAVPLVIRLALASARARRPWSVALPAQLLGPAASATPAGIGWLGVSRRGWRLRVHAPGGADAALLFRGEAELEPGRPIFSCSRLRGALFPAGSDAHRAELRFDYRKDLGVLLRALLRERVGRRPLVAS